MMFLAVSALAASSISYLAAAIHSSVLCECTCSILRKTRPT